MSVEQSPPAARDLLPGLVAHQAAASPYATAVIDAGAELSYTELDSYANQIANFLRLHYGVGPGSTVAVCVHRGVHLPAALLGVWRAGAAYCPLDPAHPQDRLAWQIADAGVRVVLTEQVLAGRTVGSRASQFCLDTDGVELAVVPDDGPEGVVNHPDDVAYTAYTSGSTGRPKGVQITHAGIANRVLWTVREHGFSAADRVLHKTSIGFDAACWEVFAPLISGGAVVMAPVGAERDPEALVRAVARHEITVLQVVPSMLRLLVDEPDWRGCESLRMVFSAGEPLYVELGRRLAERVKVELWNTYGPTECSIDVTAQLVDPALRTGPVPIGMPIDNMRAVVLSTAGAPVPAGVPGELYVGGVGVARGYLGKPGLTARKFVPDPYGPPGSRMYRTGDLVRRRADTTLEYLGRIDDQLKVNGVRIEPGEVEAVLLTHPDVRGVVVRGYTDGDGLTRMVAYVLDRDVAEPETLRAFLADRLPQALVPSVFVALAEFPTTSSGKVDRAALPDPGASRPPYLAPRTAAEHTVCEAWSALLGVPSVGAHDDFFQLGGSSLLFTRLASALGVASGREVPLPVLFEAPTVSAQAELITRDGPVLGPIERLPRGAPLPVSFGQRRQWFLDRIEPGGPEWVAPMVLRLPSGLSTASIRRALAALVARHETLRARYTVDADGEPSQVIGSPGPVELRIADATAGAGAGTDLTDLFGEQFARGFDLEHGPLVRALLVIRPGMEHVLLLTMHHITCDGWSTVVLERDLLEYCAAFHDGREPELVPLPLQYADFAGWQRRWLTEEVLERDLVHWRGALAGIVPLAMPTDRPRPEFRDPAGAMVSFSVPAQIVERVDELCARHWVTPFMVLLTAYGVLLSRYAGQDDLTVGVPVSGRLHPDTSGMAGFFLNSLVMRCDLTGAPSFADALARTRRMCLAAYAHQSVPFDRLLDDLAPGRDLARTPLYQVEFDLHDEGWTGTSVDDDDMEALRRAWRVSKTDLCLYLRRRPDGSMSGVIEYATTLFDPATVHRVARHFVRLLELVGADPGIPVHAVDFLADSEQLATVTPSASEPVAPCPGLSTGDDLTSESPAERRIAELWRELLGVDVDTRTSFFGLGGNSIQAIRLISRLRDEFGIDVPVRSFFQRPTVTDLAVEVEALIRAELAELTDAEVLAESTGTADGGA